MGLFNRSNRIKVPLTKELSDEFVITQEIEEKVIPGEKVKTIVKKINKNSKESMKNANLRNKPAKARKTINEQRMLAEQREKKALEACQKSQAELDQPQDDLNLENLQAAATVMEIDQQNLNEQEQKSEQQEPEIETMEVTPVQQLAQRCKPECNAFHVQGKRLRLQPQECQQNFRECEFDCHRKLNEQNNCCHFGNISFDLNLKKSKLKVFKPRQKEVIDMSLGKPYGIQLGALSVCSKEFPKEVRNKQVVDVILVAHGATKLKPAVHWTHQDIDQILTVGTKLYEKTKDADIDQLSEFTKGFNYKKHFIQVKIQVTMSEPTVVGEVSDLLAGLRNYFTQHKHGILQISNLDVYIAKRLAFFVFDPRGRTNDCVKSSDGEAALMVFERLENVNHLILNLSNVNVNDSFKISPLSVTQFIDCKYSLDKFTAASGNPSRCRSDDYKLLENEIAYLCGSIHINSKVFSESSGKQVLTTAIMAMVYAKIDPPNSWASTILDRVLHLGMKLYRDCLDDGIKGLTLIDIPSKFYVGDFYRAGITISPTLKRVKLKPSKFYCDDPITQALRDLLKTSQFHCFLLQIDNNAFAIWRMRNSEVYYFFDGQEKEADETDEDEGTSCVYMVGSIDKLCQIITTRIAMVPMTSHGMMDIHGLKVIELTKLNAKEQKCKPRFKMVKMDCIQPVTIEDVEKFQETPSTVDSFIPLLTVNELKLLRDESSLVVSKARIYKNIMSSVEKKLEDIENDMPIETVELVRVIYSDILRKIIDDVDTTSAKTSAKYSIRKATKDRPCGC